MFELKAGEYVDVTRYSLERRMQMFPKLPRFYLSDKYCIVFRYPATNHTDSFASATDCRDVWKGRLRNYKERHAGVNNLGRM